MSDLFAELYKRPDARLGHLGVDDFLATYRRLGGAPATATTLERVIDAGVAERADAFFAEALRQAGVAVERAPLAEGTLDPGAFVLLLTALLGRCDCGEAVPVTVGARSLTFLAHPGCQVFRRGFELTHVDGFPVPRQPAKAWADAVLRLGHGQPLALRREGVAGSVPLSCPASRLDGSYTTLLRPPPPRSAATGAQAGG